MTPTRVARSGVCGTRRRTNKPAIAGESTQAASGTAGKAQRSLCCPSELHVIHTWAHGYTWLHTLHKPRRMGKQL